MEVNQIAIYTSPKGEVYKGEVYIEARLKDETLWLNQNQMADLFGVNQPAIAKHLHNVFKSSELEEKSVHSILECTAKDGKKYKTKFYNLDAILSVGYRVNSQKATLFRIWATKTLKNLLLRGYSVDERLLLAERKRLEEIRDKISEMLEG
ncbi:MAG: RhuM family protein [Patescibacteria group bacterium]